MGRVNLRQPSVFRGNGRDHGTLERPCGNDHTMGLDHPFGGLDRETRTTDIALDPAYLNARANRRLEFARIGFEVIGDPLFRGETVRAQVVELKPWKTIVPGRPVGHQRVPASSAPCLGNPATLEDQVRDAQFAQMLTHGDASLTCANHERIDFDVSSCHTCVLHEGGCGRILCRNRR